jgi:hypothetical protein
MLIMALLGLVLIVVGQINMVWLKIDFGSISANVGAYIIFVGVLNWLFEYFAKKTLIQEISSTTVGLSEVIQSGIEGYYQNSKRINFENSLKHADNVAILFSYSARFIDDYGPLLLKRMESGASVRLNFLARESGTLSLMIDMGWDTSSVEAAYKKIERFRTDGADCEKGECLVKYVDVIPRYSLVIIDKEMYIIFSTCGNRRQDVPALKIKFGSPMWNFLDADLKDLKAYG